MAADGSPAAFFDLDRTLMEGSSAFQFGRAAYRAGLLSRRQLIADGWANLMFRLRGASDESSHELRNRISQSLEGTRVRDLERLGVDVLAGVLPRIYPQVLELAYGHQDEGRRVYIVTAASQDLAEMLARVLAFDGAIGSQFSEVVDGVYTGRPAGLFIYGREKARAIERARRARGARPRELLRLLGFRVGPADAAARRPSRRGQPRQAAGQGRARGALGGAPLRPARAAAEGGGWAGGRRGRRRRRVGGAGRARPEPAGSRSQTEVSSVAVIAANT